MFYLSDPLRRTNDCHTARHVLHLHALLHAGGQQRLSAAQGTDRDQQHLNIFLEFVPGGSIASLLAKFGASLSHALHEQCR